VKAILKNTWAVLNRKEKKRFSTLLLLDITISVLDILSLALLLWIVQVYIQPGNIGDLSFLPPWLADKDSILFIAIFVILFGLKNIVAFLVARAHYKFIGKVAVRISKHNLSSYQLSSYDEFVNTDSSVHIRKVAFQPFEFGQYMLAGIQQIITQLCLITIAIVAILLFNAKLFLLLLLILLPPVILVFYWIKNKLTAAKKNIRINNEKSFQYLLEALKAYVEGNIFNRNQFFLKRFVNFRQKFSDSLFDSISLQNLPGRFIEIFAVLGLFILIAIAKWTNNNDSNTLLTIGAFMAAAYRIIPGIVKIINTIGQIKTYEFSLNDLVQTGQQLNGKENKPAPAINSIELKNIHFSYPNQPALNNFSLSIEKGDLVGITGLSGKGKTTILNLLLGLLSPAKGEIIFNNHRMNGDIKSYWPSISYVRQQPFFIHDTLLRNITLEESGYKRDDLENALRVSGLDELIKTFPEKGEKVISENGKNISGGQQQRIAIARALYKSADLILLDEPFNELDEASETKMLGHFRKMTEQGKMILLVTHNKKSLSYCNKIVSLDEQD
jgi:ABC-type bacteriocin/lantibiotic exporter with double-glycine peptidase domain